MTLSRDAPSVIRGRIHSVTVSCIICSVMTFVFLSSAENGGPGKSLHRMGFLPIGFMETAKALALTAILFMGPIFENGIAEGRCRDWIRLRGLSQTLKGWIGYRNFVAVRLTVFSTYNHTYKSSAGPNNRRNPLPFLLRPSAPTRPNFEHNNHLPNSHNLRSRPHPSFLRIPRPTPTYPALSSCSPHAPPTHLHHPIRRLRYVYIHAHWQCAGLYDCPRFL